MLLKPTSRYRFNKFLSEQPLAKIHYAADVSSADQAKIPPALMAILERTSVTLILVENHTPRGIL